MGARIGVGLLGLGTVGGGVASILLNPQERHPLVKDLELVRVAVRDLKRSRPVELPDAVLTTDPAAVVNDPAVDVVVEVIGGIEPARTLILQAIEAGKSVVTANKAVIARHGTEIAAAAKAAGVYVLIEAAVGGQNGIGQLDGTAALEIAHSNADQLQVLHKGVTFLGVQQDRCHPATHGAQTQQADADPCSHSLCSLMER